MIRVNVMMGDLMIIIGNGGKGDGYEWGDYFKIYEWRNDRLEKVERLEW